MPCATSRAVRMMARMQMRSMSLTWHECRWLMPCATSRAVRMMARMQMRSMSRVLRFMKMPLEMMSVREPCRQ